MLRERLASVGRDLVEAVISEVPSYADPFRSGMGATIERAVRVALEGFLELISNPDVAFRREHLPRVQEAAYALGQGEARAGRSIDALTSAYGVGTRVAWRAVGDGIISAGLPAREVARFAELLFAYINDLSVQSITGHAEELAAVGRIRQRRLERLAQKLIDGEPEEALLAAARVAEWDPPRQLVAVVLGIDDIDRVLRAGLQALAVGEDWEGLPAGSTAVLVAVAGEAERTALLAALAQTAAVVGPRRPWTRVRESYVRAARILALGVGVGVGVGVAAGVGVAGGVGVGVAGAVDSDAHLLELVLGADAGALADLRSQVLAPLDALAPGPRARLTETLRAWLLHHGRREAIAQALVVHPQTVRYRVGQLRDLFGADLADPQRVLELTVALAGWHAD